MWLPVAPTLIHVKDKTLSNLKALKPLTSRRWLTTVRWSAVATSAGPAGRANHLRGYCAPTLPCTSTRLLTLFGSGGACAFYALAPNGRAT